MNTFIFLILTIVSVYAQDQLFTGPCQFDKFTTKQPFDAQKYEGKWYEIQRYHKSNKMDCAQQEYEWKQTSVINKYKFGMFYVHVRGRNLQKNSENIELFQLPETVRSYGKGQYFYSHTGWPYWIIDTDYTTYSVIWSCWEEDFQALNQHEESLVVLGRDWNLNIETIPALQATLNKFDRTKLDTVVQNDKRCGHQGTENDNNEDQNSNTDNENKKENTDTDSVAHILPNILLLIVIRLISSLL